MQKVLSNFSLKKVVSSVKSLFNSHEVVKKSVDEIKDQVDDQLNSINENTNEIQSNYVELQPKINRLAERIDEISMLIGLNQSQKKHEIPRLTTIEKEVFLALYTLCEEKESATYDEISKTVNLSETLVMNYITILIEKGVPIIKSYSDDRTKIKLSSYFKSIQTKNNVLKINEDISKQIVLNSFIQK